MRYYPRFSTTPYRGVAGGRIREDDESHGRDAPSAPRAMLAKFTSKCVVTGERINPGDEITYQRGVGSTLVKRNTTPPADGRYISDVFRTSGGGEFYRNKAGRCEDAPCCGCCTI